MSFVDLATLTFHRRHELESRIKVLDQKCDRAIDDLNKMKLKAHGFTDKLNCDSSELKERFLMLMKTLDEYIYLVTDFNLAISQIEDFNNFKFAPVQDTSRPTLRALPPPLTPIPLISPHTPILTPQILTATPPAPSKLPHLQTAKTSHTSSTTPPIPTITPHTQAPTLLPAAVPTHTPAVTPSSTLTPLNLIDALSEPTPSASCTCPNNCPPEKPKKIRIPKEEQTLIAFSSSTSSESVPDRKSEMNTKEVQSGLTDDMNNLAVEEPQESNPQEAEEREEVDPEETCRLPAATLLKADHKYEGTIMSVDGTFFWVITDVLDEVQKFMCEMTDYYMSNSTQLSPEEFNSLTICAFFDEESDCVYRALYLKPSETDSEMVDVFVVDTGELRGVPRECVQRLVPQYCTRAPYARFCYLAGIDLQAHQDKMKEQEELIKTFIGKPCIIEVDDNASESYGVYVHLPTGQTINQILILRGLAEPIDKIEEPSPCKKVVMGPPEIRDDSDLNVDLMEQPEHEDPVVAVTGYHNRDEADICKHYKGGPEKTCFKGQKCTKRHVVKHPDGWTLDRVEVPCKLMSVPLPAPDTWLQVFVTAVCHFDRLYVHIHEENKEEEELPEFGVVLPPTTLTQLVRDLNSHATRSQLKPLKLAPSPGELVLALYPLDNCWYRARVLSVIRSDQSVEVLYVDYGTVLFVKEDQIRKLESRFLRLPAQGVMCVLAGVHQRSRDTEVWKAAKRKLTDMVEHKKLTAHVISREFDEITIELIDEKGYNIAEQLAALKLIKLEPYDVIEDTHKITVP